jgi:hypothetical protein
MKKGLPTPRKLHLQLKATNGEIYTFIYPKAAAVNFETGANISAANKWRKQILNWRLHISGSGGDRAPWTKEETEEIKGKKGYKKGRLLAGDELAEIARATGRSITAAESMMLRLRQKDAAVKDGGEEDEDEMEGEEEEGEEEQGGELKHGLEGRFRRWEGWDKTSCTACRRHSCCWILD